MLPRLHKLRTKLHDGESFKEADYDMVFGGVGWIIEYYLGTTSLSWSIARDHRPCRLDPADRIVDRVLRAVRDCHQLPDWVICVGLIMQQDYVTYLMYNGVFIILGIGCDDIFVLMDAWKQSAMHPVADARESLLLRFTWAYMYRAGRPCSLRP